MFIHFFLSKTRGNSEFIFTDTVVNYHIGGCVSPGGVPFIEQHGDGESAASSISSPTADSGLANCSKATSKEDLTDLESCSTATTPSTAASPDALMLDTQVKLMTTLVCCSLVGMYFLSVRSRCVLLLFLMNIMVCVVFCYNCVLCFVDSVRVDR